MVTFDCNFIFLKQYCKNSKPSNQRLSLNVAGNSQSCRPNANHKRSRLKQSCTHKRLGELTGCKFPFDIWMALIM